MLTMKLSHVRLTPTFPSRYIGVMEQSLPHAGCRHRLMRGRTKRTENSGKGYNGISRPFA